MKNKNKIMMILAIVLGAYMCQGDACILQPNIPSLANEFPAFSYSIITMIQTVSALFLGIAALCTNKLAQMFGKKRLLLAGSLLFSISGSLTCIAPGFVTIILCRIVEGFGAGIVVTGSMMLIPQLFTDENEGNRIVGYNAVVTAASGAFLGVTAGYIGVFSWRWSTLLYLIGLIIFIFQFFFIPSDKEIGSTPEHTKYIRGGITKPAWSVAIMAFLFAVISTIYMTWVANFIVEQGLGDSSQAGITVSVMTIGTFTAGFVFARVFAKLKELTPALSYICMALGVIIPLLRPEYSSVLIGTIIFGAGYGLYFPYMNAEAMSISPEASMDANLSLVNGGFYTGMFASSFLMVAIGIIAGTSSAYFYFQFMAVSFIVFVIYYLFLYIREKNVAKKPVAGAPEQ